MSRSAQPSRSLIRSTPMATGMRRRRCPLIVRGIARVAIGGDLGAYAAPGTFDTPSLVADTLVDQIGYSAGWTSLREAIGCVASGAPSGAITFAVGGVIMLGGTEPALSGAVTIDGDVDGDGAGDVTIGAGGLSRALHVLAGADAALSGLVVRGGATAGNGGGIAVRGSATLDLDDVTAPDSAVSIGGGIIVDTFGAMTARDLVVTDSQASVLGGGLANRGDATIVNAEVSYNDGGTLGGSIASYPFSDATLANVTLHGNVAQFTAAMAMVQSTATLDHVTITANEATDASAAPNGALTISMSDVAVTNSIIAGNIGAAFPDLFIHTDALAAFPADAVLLGSAPVTDGGPTLAGTPGLIGVAVTTLFQA
jgi:hypothetical protein